MGSVSVTMRTEPLRLWLRICIHYKAFRAGRYPLTYLWYVVRPVAFTVRELYPKIGHYVKQLRRAR